MSPRRTWDTPQPLSRQRVCPSPPNRGGRGHTRLRVRGWGRPNSVDWRKSLVLCLLCGIDATHHDYYLGGGGPSGKSLFSGFTVHDNDNRLKVEKPSSNVQNIYKHALTVTLLLTILQSSNSNIFDSSHVQCNRMMQIKKSVVKVPIIDISAGIPVLSADISVWYRKKD